MLRQGDLPSKTGQLSGLYHAMEQIDIFRDLLSQGTEAPVSRKKSQKNSLQQNKFDVISWLSKKSTVSKLVNHIA
jgi:hypothetical protein